MISPNAVPSIWPIATNSRPSSDTHPQEDDPPPEKLPRSAWFLKSRRSIYGYRIGYTYSDINEGQIIVNVHCCIGMSGWRFLLQQLPTHPHNRRDVPTKGIDQGPFHPQLLFYPTPPTPVSNNTTRVVWICIAYIFFRHDVLMNFTTIIHLCSELPDGGPGSRQRRSQHGCPEELHLGVIRWVHWVGILSGKWLDGLKHLRQAAYASIYPMPRRRGVEPS